MKNLIIQMSFIALVILSYSSCGHSHGSDHSHHNHHHSDDKSKGFDIPELKERQLALGSNEEMDRIQNIYSSAVADLEKDKNNIDALLTLAEVFINEARTTGDFGYNYQSATLALDRVLAENPSKDHKFHALSLKGLIMLSYHQFEDALKIGEEALDLNPHNAGVYGILVDANVELGNYVKAVEMADKMVSIRPDLRSYSRVSYLREIHGDLTGAIEAMDMAVKAGYPGQEQTEWSRVKLGQLHEKKGDLETAELQFRSALNYRENYPHALAALASVETKKENFDEAERLLKLALTYIEDAGFYQQLATIYKIKVDEFDYAKAVTNAQSILAGLDQGHDHNHDHNHGHDHGHSHEVGLEMGKLLLNFTGDTEEALDNFLEEYKRRPNNIEVNEALAQAYLKLGKLEKANFHLEKASIDLPTGSFYLCLKGILEYKSGNKNLAQEIIKTSLEQNPFQVHSLTQEMKAIL
ncbi:MAG: tetratricopeptide repeat protein [Flavobacteriales bacterium]|nr:tetratricopeptide repeat protein [Flavobacteriales bacterium]